VLKLDDVVETARRARRAPSPWTLGLARSACVLIALLALAVPGPVKGAGGGITPRVVYGADDRKEVYEYTHDPLLRVANSTAILIDDSLVISAGGGWDIDIWAYGTYGQFFELCPSERFWDQPTPGLCSAFVVGADLIVTAGHCVNPTWCSTTSFAFGFKMQDASTVLASFPYDDVYHCQDVLISVSTATEDYAVVRVDRPIVGHPPLPIRRLGAVEDPEVEGLFDVSHPSGIPQKIIGGPTPIGTTGLSGASVKGSAVGYFESNLDVHAGSSGSPVASLDEDGEFLYVEGILVRGNVDFVWSGECNVANICPDETGCTPGVGFEEVSRTTRFDGYVPGYCGDLTADPQLQEECDDGNTESGDGCSATCLLELVPVPALAPTGVLLLGGMLLTATLLTLSGREG